MAIPSKKEIDFDVYQRQDPASTVDWGKAAKDITTTFQGIRDTRQAKKDAIEKSYQDQQKHYKILVSMTTLLFSSLL